MRLSIILASFDADGPGGCTASGNTGTCPGASGFRFDLGDGEDSASVGAAANGGAVSTGGAENDSLDGGATPGCVESGGGDELNGDGGDDSLCGGAGPASGNGSDALSGGDGDDHAWYLRSANVSISLDNSVGDGESGEADNVGADVEDVTTGSGSKVLVGSARASWWSRSPARQSSARARGS
jgi:hypothetical protein